MTLQISSIGFGIAGTAFLTFFVVSVTKWRERVRGSLLPFASAATVVWAVVFGLSQQPISLGSVDFFLAEMLLVSSWMAFLLSMLRGAIAPRTLQLFIRSAVVLCLGLLVVGLLFKFADGFAPPRDSAGLVFRSGLIATSIYMLILLEQLYRNARDTQRAAVKFLVLGLAATFSYSAFLFGDALVYGRLSTELWEARGFVVALSAALIALAVRRGSDWNRGLFVSRKVVFYGAFTAIAALGLSIIALLTVYIGQVEGVWRSALQALFLWAATIGFLILLISTRVRAATSVFLAKNFLARRYDYRAEWLRLLETLTSYQDGLPLEKRAVKSFAQILAANKGWLWLLEDGSDRFGPAASWNTQPLDTELHRGEPVADFLERTGWVIEMRKVREGDQSYRDLPTAGIDPIVLGFDYVIPLVHANALIGVVALAESNRDEPLNFEDFDLLKAAAEQVASYLAQDAASRKLAENRQFEGFNRLTAYLMHDLTNLLAQQALIVENAEKHRDNPRFVDDVIETVDSSVSRMRRILDQLRRRHGERNLQKVELGRMVSKAASMCADRAPAPELRLCEDAYWVLADADSLHMSIVNAVRNAQDATDSDGRILIESDLNSERYQVRIVDNGVGMDTTFVRDKLFAPFVSTKGIQGMGIGAYQIRETVRSIGAEVSIDSQPGVGTTFSIEFPRTIEVSAESVQAQAAGSESS